MLQSVQPYNNIAQMPYIMPPVNSQNSIQMPQGARNHILVDPVKVDYFVKQKENALPYIFLQTLTMRLKSPKLFTSQTA